MEDDLRELSIVAKKKKNEKKKNYGRTYEMNVFKQA
jgi:hypothetical protein